MTKYRLTWPLHTAEFLTEDAALVYRDALLAETPGLEVSAPEPIEYEPIPEPTPPRKQSARTVLARLTDAEYDALTLCPVVAIKRALETARIEAVISDADPDFPAFVAGCDALGIISANRWDALLAS